MSTIHRFKGNEDRFDWEDVELITYSDDKAKGASGRILIGTEEGAEHFVFRYFCIEPGGHSALEDFHAHPHGVMILHGRALVTLEDRQVELEPHDVLFIEPWERHSLAAVGDQPLGFLCVIPNKKMLERLR